MTIAKPDKQDNDWSIGKLIVLCLTIIMVAFILVWGSVVTKLADNPLIFRIEVDDNMVKVAQAMNGTRGCGAVECKCPYNGGWYYDSWKNYSYHEYNYSGDWHTYWDGDNIIYVKGTK